MVGKPPPQHGMKLSLKLLIPTPKKKNLKEFIGINYKSLHIQFWTNYKVALNIGKIVPGVTSIKGFF